jgi:hypothetical protein
MNLSQSPPYLFLSPALLQLYRACISLQYHSTLAARLVSFITIFLRFNHVGELGEAQDRHNWFATLIRFRMYDARTDERRQKVVGSLAVHRLIFCHGIRRTTLPSIALSSLKPQR